MIMQHTAPPLLSHLLLTFLPMTNTGKHECDPPPPYVLVNGSEHHESRLSPSLPLTYDIVDHVCDLPDLVIDTVLLHLSYAHVWALVYSSDAEVLRLARRQQWRRVCVSELQPMPGFSYTITTKRFHEMVSSGTPPLHPIHHLDYHADNYIEDDFMTDTWHEYVAKHTKLVGLSIGITPTEMAVWTPAASHLHTLNLVSLELNCSVERTTFMKSMLSTVGRLSSLRRLTLRIGYCPFHLWSELAIPEGVRDLKIYQESAADPWNPEDSKMRLCLRDLVSRGADISSNMGLFPVFLDKLTIFSYNRPMIVSHRALERFPHLQHNLVVCEESNVGELDGAKYGLGCRFFLDACVPADYSAVDLPSGLTLRIESSVPSRYKVLPVRTVNHWISRVEKLELVLPLDLTGVVIPPGVQVVGDVQGSTPSAETWSSYGNALVSMRGGLLAIHPQMAPMEHVRKLALTWSNGQLGMVFPAFESLEELALITVDCQACPDLTHLLRCTRLHVGNPGWRRGWKDVSYWENLVIFDPHLLPASVEHLKLEKGKFLDPSGNAEGASFDHLKRLKSLHMVCMHINHLLLRPFPDALVELRMVCSLFHLVERLVFLPRLRTLALESHNLVDPWTFEAEMSTLSPWWKSMAKRRIARVFPETLRELELGHVVRLKMALPPGGFRYPRGLVRLGLTECGIADVSKFRLPSTLRELTISSKHVDVTKGFDWLRLKELNLQQENGLTRGGRFSPKEKALLRGKMPGVHIMFVEV